MKIETYTNAFWISGTGKLYKQKMVHIIEPETSVLIGLRAETELLLESPFKIGKTPIPTILENLILCENGDFLLSEEGFNLMLN